MDIDRGRLIQERWLSLFRWLLIEACLVQGQLLQDPRQILDQPLVQLVVAFMAYTLLVTLAVAFRRTWPVPLAYTTAAIDSLAAGVITGWWPGESFANPALLGTVMAAVGVGIRRFVVFDTFAFSLLIAVAMFATRFISTFELPLSERDSLVIAAVALLPVLARAATLAPNQGSRDDPMGRLLGSGRKAMSDVDSAGRVDAEHLYYGAASALAAYAECSIAGLMIREPNGGASLYTIAGEGRQVDRLPPPSDETLVSRLLGIHEARIFGRRDDLGTRGLPDQYPPRLDSLVAAPVPDVSGPGGTLFAVNRRAAGSAPMISLWRTSLGARSLAYV